MKYINNLLDRPISQVALGCMRIANMTEKEVDNYINSAIEFGYNFFDHADIYGKGTCESVFGESLKRNPSLRDKIVIQTKCGIKSGTYNFSTEHIIYSVENSLKKLNCEQIDVLILHRPDLLMQPEEVAKAFDMLEQSGKVKYFGVSNHSPMQIEILKTCVKQDVKFNQLQLSVVNASMISSGANVNVQNADGVVRDGYVRDYCRLKGITIQPWSPLQHGFIEGPFLTNEKFSEVNGVIREIADKYGVTDTGLAISWLLRLPEKMQVIVGSTNLERIKQIAEASDITLTREEWYKIYRSAGYKLP